MSRYKLITITLTMGICCNNYFCAMLYFSTKEQNNLRRENEFLDLPPELRLQIFFESFSQQLVFEKQIDNNNPDNFKLTQSDRRILQTS